MHSYCRYSVSQYWYISVTFKIIQVSKEKDIGGETGEYLRVGGCHKKGQSVMEWDLGILCSNSKGHMTCRNGVESGGAMQICRRVNVRKFAGWRKVRGEVTRVGKGVTGWDKRFRGWWSYMQEQKRESQMAGWGYFAVRYGEESGEGKVGGEELVRQSQAGIDKLIDMYIR